MRGAVFHALGPGPMKSATSGPTDAFGPIL